MDNGRHANPEDFGRGFDFCVSQRATDSLALIFSNKFSERGYIDFSEGCAHYALIYKVANVENSNGRWMPHHEPGSTCRLIMHRVNHTICEGCKQWAKIITREAYNYSPEQLEFAHHVTKMMGTAPTG